MAAYYYGRRWGTFTNAVEALIDAKYPRAFAEKVVRDTDGSESELFVAREESSGVRLVRTTSGIERWYVRFAPRFRTAEMAFRAARRMPAPSSVSSTASSFAWTGEPRRPGRTPGG